MLQFALQLPKLTSTVDFSNLQVLLLQMDMCCWHFFFVFLISKYIKMYEAKEHRQKHHRQCIEWWGGKWQRKVVIAHFFVFPTQGNKKWGTQQKWRFSLSIENCQIAICIGNIFLKNSDKIILRLKIHCLAKKRLHFSGRERERRKIRK